jgi:hypothetical protein
MQASLFDITLVAQLFLFMGYLLYGVMRTYPSEEDRFSILFYVSLMIGFVTAILVLNSVLSFSRYLPEDVPILIVILGLDVIFFFAALGDAFRHRKLHTESDENTQI